ncbi:MAG: flagellin [Methylocella sp.]
MASLPTKATALTALAALAPTEQNLNQGENQVAAGLAIPAAANTLGASTANLRTQWTYVSNPNDSLTTGVGSLVDANMNEAAAKLAPLQVQQQLGVQVLSISHSNAKLILELLEL